MILNLIKRQPMFSIYSWKDRGKNLLLKLTNRLKIFAAPYKKKLKIKAPLQATQKKNIQRGINGRYNKRIIW